MGRDHSLDGVRVREHNVRLTSTSQMSFTLVSLNLLEGNIKKDDWLCGFKQSKAKEEERT